MNHLLRTTALIFIFGLNLFAQEKLGYHIVRTDKDGFILPWYDDNPAVAFDHIIGVTWNFWDTMRVDKNGIPYYLNHQVWRSDFNDPRGIGGDQIQMALSSWHLLYQYSGDDKVKDNMTFLADYYLSRGLSPKNAAWSDLPYPYNTLLYSGAYDGDMVIGKNFTQPDKAGSMGFELAELYEMMSNEHYPHTADKNYLDAAIAIANTLARHVTEGDDVNSPLPFKVNALNGEVGSLENNVGMKKVMLSSYTTNWSATMELFLTLIKIKKGNILLYQHAFDKILSWMKKYPMQTNKWGPFFEDVPGWSDTQINAMTWARFIMNHRELFPSWRSDAAKIINWVDYTLANEQWKKFGVTAINEQTAFRVPGNSHTARQGADELFFAYLTADAGQKNHAIRQLTWATYFVDVDGKNQFPTDEVWLTDGYGDFIRHYLRAMAALPELARGDQVHILSSTSIIQHVAYSGNFHRFNSPDFDEIDKNQVVVAYNVFDKSGIEVIRMPLKPRAILLNKKPVIEVTDLITEGFRWEPTASGGVLTIKRKEGDEVIVLK